MIFHRNLPLVAGVMALLVSAAMAVPEPSLILAPGEWLVDVQFHSAPQPIMVKLAGEDQPRRFWYLTYTVTNNTGEDIDFYPRVEAFTNTFKLYETGVKNRREVFEAIRDRYNNTIPLMEPRDFVSGKLLQGQDNARDSVIIFEDFDPEATSLKIFFAGLSNESEEITINSIGKSKKFLLHRTLMLQYQIPGDRFNPDKRVLLYRDREWIMR